MVLTAPSEQAVVNGKGMRVRERCFGHSPPSSPSSHCFPFRICRFSLKKCKLLDLILVYYIFWSDPDDLIGSGFYQKGSDPDPTKKVRIRIRNTTTHRAQHSYCSVDQLWFGCGTILFLIRILQANLIF